ncbi:MAG: TerC family protein [Chromatiaceae bacterium]|jgi:predicted tellurium resistance membrane protein TerC|nr:TerC family protein [Chromatiaceae bacterium]
MFDWIFLPEAWLALATLTALEIVLGIDNIIFLTILVGRLPEHQRQRGRVIGLALAMGTRIALLLSLAWMMKLVAPWFIILGHEISGRDLILILGGLFLLFKSTMEIHEAVEGPEAGEPALAGKAGAGFVSIVVQIAIIDIVFSLDSVITAVGMASQVPVMVIAIILAVGVMMFAAKPIGDFVDLHPTIKMLALSFLVLIGFALVGEGFDLHIPKGYIYFAMAFSLGVEMVNMRMRAKVKPVELRKWIEEDAAEVPRQDIA